MKNSSLLLCVVLLILLVGEAIFMYIPLRVGTGDALSSNTWLHYYWKTNSMGLRDKEIAEKDTSNKRSIMVLGDSFVAGLGVNHDKDLFPNLLSTKLADDFVVYNLGVCGHDTKDEYQNLLDFPVRPEMIVLVHVPNDIEKLNNQSIWEYPRKTLDIVYAGFLVLPGLEWINERSFFVNFIYWQFKKMGNSKEGSMNALQFFQGPYGRNHFLAKYLDERQFNRHFQDIQLFLDYGKANDIPVVVVLFPVLIDRVFEFSNEYINLPIGKRIKNQGNHVIDMGMILEGTTETDRVVNVHDSHPNEFVHGVLADTLYNYLRLQSLPN